MDLKKSKEASLPHLPTQSELLTEWNCSRQDLSQVRNGVLRSEANRLATAGKETFLRELWNRSPFHRIGQLFGRSQR
jgi:aspartyl/asparaginyl beta-hydroxylase (cupin superfamily)